MNDRGLVLNYEFAASSVLMISLVDEWCGLAATAISFMV
jgi:hypothetical protein